LYLEFHEIVSKYTYPHFVKAFIDYYYCYLPPLGNTILAKQWQSVLFVEEARQNTDLLHVTDKPYHTKQYRIHLSKARCRMAP
jgi:hypothetical protein